MKKILVPVISILAVFAMILIFSYVFPWLASFLSWWFITKEEINAPISTGQAVIIDTITHLVTYSAVGALFGYFGWFNGKVMHYAYVIISEVVALSLAVLLRFIWDYYWIIFIILGVLIILLIVFLIPNSKKKPNIDNKEDGNHE